MYCRKCGSKLKDNAKFCSKCGITTEKTKVIEIKEDEEKLESKANSIVTLLIVLITIIISIGTIIVLNIL